MKRLEEALRAFLTALGQVGQDCRADLQVVWADFREDMAILRQCRQKGPECFFQSLHIRFLLCQIP